jgi:hypothetical protein
MPLLRRPSALPVLCDAAALVLPARRSARAADPDGPPSGRRIRAASLSERRATRSREGPTRPCSRGLPEAGRVERVCTAPGCGRTVCDRRKTGVARETRGAAERMGSPGARAPRERKASARRGTFPSEEELPARSSDHALVHKRETSRQGPSFTEAIEDYENTWALATGTEKDDYSIIAPTRSAAISSRRIARSCVPRPMPEC